jgi:hypothetical protein
MRKILFLFLFLSLNSAFADIEDDSIIKELDKDQVKELNVNFNLKSFESCKVLEDVMEGYIKDYWTVNKDKYRYPLMYRRSEPVMMEDSISESSELQSVSNKTSSIKKESDYSKTNTQVL